MTILDRTRLVLAGRWPRHGTSDALSPAQTRLVEADRIRPCAACGCPCLVPPGRPRGTADLQEVLPGRGIFNRYEELPAVEKWLPCQGVADVITAVRFARERDQHARPRSRTGAMNPGP